MQAVGEGLLLLRKGSFVGGRRGEGRNMLEMGER